MMMISGMARKRIDVLVLERQIVSKVMVLVFVNGVSIRRIYAWVFLSKRERFWPWQKAKHFCSCLFCFWSHFDKDDVNTVSFADDTSHLIYSGSDDSYCKVWDRRCLSSRAQPAGTLVGHLEGITFIDSRGDGRYFISNGKDQTTKMWDIRKMTAGNPSIKSRSSSGNEWDYRWMEYPRNRKNAKHPYDQSLMTYRGHAVLRTLVRCYFSPSFSTGQKYIYTGSHDGCVYIYDVVSGNLIKKLDHHRSTVRDCSWHPLYPTLVSCSWDGVVAKWDHSRAKSRRSRSP